MRRRWPLVALGLLLSSWGSGLSAQTTEQRATACAAGGGDPAACAAAAVSARQVIAQIGLMTSPGAEIPGEGSTLGRRLGGMPRIAAWIRGAAQPVSVPEPADPNGPEEASAWTPTLQAGLALGVFDGFQLLPTVGGFLSLDVVGHTDFLFLSDGSGFADRVDVLSFGARVGLLQESFTLPGVSVSITRRLSGDAHLGDIAAGDAVEVVTDPSITSFRLTVSKDFLALGFLAGVGWDDVSGDTRLVVPDGLGDPILSDGGFEASRRMFFGSVSKQLGILAWATVEAGWAEGFDPVAGYVGAFDPSGSTLFGSVSLLLKL